MPHRSHSVTAGGDLTKAKSVQIYQCQQRFALTSYALHVFSHLFSLATWKKHYYNIPT